MTKGTIQSLGVVLGVVLISWRQRDYLVVAAAALGQSDLSSHEERAAKAPQRSLMADHMI